MFDRTTYGKVLVPIVTPFTEDGDLDLGAMRELIDYLIENNKADTLILSGTTGEFHMKSMEERTKVFEVGVEHVAGRLPVMAGTGATSTQETIELGRRAKDAGIDTHMVVAPYYAKPNQSELQDHYERVAGELGDVNVMLYNIPIFTGVNLEPDVVGALAQVPNIVAIKDEAELNPKQITQYLRATPDDFVIYNGDDTMILETYAQGGAARVGGVISGASHLVGDFVRTMIETFLAGDVAKAAQMQAKLYPVLKVMGQSGRTNPAPLWKEAMRLVGLTAGFPRAPLSPATKEERENIVAALREFGIDL